MDLNNSHLAETPRGDPQVVAFLERMLADAKLGRIIGVGVVMVMEMSKDPIGRPFLPWGTQIAGYGMAEIHIGAGALQRTALDIVLTPRQSRIMRPVS